VGGKLGICPPEFVKIKSKLNKGRNIHSINDKNSWHFLIVKIILAGKM
jgi:hypothetical protein